MRWFLMGALVACSTPKTTEDKDKSRLPRDTAAIATTPGTASGPTSGTPATTPPKTVSHVVILGIDGMGGRRVAPASTPQLDALTADSLTTFEMQNALPTSSSTNWMSMIGGTSPDQHGVLSNGWDPGDSSPPPTLFATLRAQRPDAKIGVFHDWADFGRLVEPGSADVISHPGDEAQTMAAAIAWMRTERPDLLMIHLDHVDHAGHLTTWGSGTYNDAITEADRLLGDLFQALQDEGMWDDTLLIVSADHGGSGLSHGNDSTDERAIPFVLHAPWTVQGTVDREVRIWDIAATAAQGLGIQPDPAWVGRALPEAFDGLPPGPAGSLPLAATSTWTWVFDDAGSGALQDLSVWRPDLPKGYALLGDAAMGSHTAPPVGSIAVDPGADGVSMPIAYEELWNTDGSGADNPVGLWNPIPDPGFVCLGTVASQTPGTPPPLDAVRCVHQDFLVPADPSKTWDDTLSGADWDAGLWTCLPPKGVPHTPRTFQTRRDHDDPGTNRCRGFDSTRVTGL